MVQTLPSGWFTIVILTLQMELVSHNNKKKIETLGFERGKNEVKYRSRTGVISANLGEIKEFEEIYYRTLGVHCRRSHTQQKILTRHRQPLSCTSGVCYFLVCPIKVSSRDAAQSRLGGGKEESMRKEDDD